MKRKSIFIICGAVAIIALLFVLLRSGTLNVKRGSIQTVQIPTQKNEETVPVISEIRGSATLERQGNKISAWPRMQLREGDVIAVSPTGTVSILWTRYGRSVLAGGTTLALRETSAQPAPLALRVRLELESGRVWTRLERLLGPESSFSVRAQNVVATVRGTSFGVTLLADTKVNVQVMESTVSVSRVRDIPIATKGDFWITAMEELIGEAVLLKPLQKLDVSTVILDPIPRPSTLTSQELRDPLLLEGHMTIPESALTLTPIENPKPSSPVNAPLPPPEGQSSPRGDTMVPERRQEFRPPASSPSRTTPPAPTPSSPQVAPLPASPSEPERPFAPPPAPLQPTPLPTQPSQQIVKPESSELEIERFLDRTSAPAEPAALIPSKSIIR